ncbi:MAG: IS630 family transposase [Terriglobales bacterium]
MGRPYSLDLRERVVAAVADGMSRAEAALQYGVSHSSAIRWTKLNEETGSPAARPMGGKKPYALAAEEDWIRARLTEKPDLTGRELLVELNKRGVEVSYYGVWHYLAHLGLSFKKSLRASEQDREDVAYRRQQWKARQTKVASARLIFIDETWAKTNMTRTHGRCTRGRRLVAKVPHGNRRTFTFVAGLRHDGITAPCLLDGPIDGDSFIAWVEQALVPTLRPGNIVVMDNLSSHKDPAIRHAIRSAGAKLFYLPPYSPDLNPIEQAFSKLKTLLRKENARSFEAIEMALAGLLKKFTPEECCNFFTEAGYAQPQATTL